MIMMGHFKVRRAHNQWRVGHEFHAEVTSRLERLTEMGLLECLGGTTEPEPEVPAEPKKGKRRGVQVRDEQTGDGDVRP